jgi:hypothetical protein
MSEFPEIITHNYDPARGACRNLCALAQTDAEAVLDDIRASGRRTIKANYLQRRLATEQWLIAESKRKLGAVPLPRPIYFFLGDFADGQDRSRPRSLVMPLAAFSPEMLTFTYGDSMASFPGAAKPDHLTKDYHGMVFSLDEMMDVVMRFGLPGDRWKTDPSMLYAKFIEVQVWDDTPIKRLLGAPRSES